jgi:hypothetical protein
VSAMAREKAQNGNREVLIFSGGKELYSIFTHIIKELCLVNKVRLSC